MNSRFLFISCLKNVLDNRNKKQKNAWFRLFEAKKVDNIWPEIAGHQMNFNQRIQILIVLRKEKFKYNSTAFALIICLQCQILVKRIEFLTGRIWQELPKVQRLRMHDKLKANMGLIIGQWDEQFFLFTSTILLLADVKLKSIVARTIT